MRKLARMALAAAAVIGLTGFAGASAEVSEAARKPTIVLVHGAFAGSSSWDGVISILSGDGYPVIAAANPPDRPSSLRKPVLILAFLFAAFTALCAGLLRVFLGRRFVTAGSASRTLDLPVLAVAPSKGR